MEAWVPSLVRPADLALLVVDLTSGSLLEDVETAIDILSRSKVALVSQGSPPPPMGWANVETLIVANKVDLTAGEGAAEILRSYYGSRFAVHAVSAQTGVGLEPLRRMIYDGLKIVRAYAKPPGKEPSMQAPIVLRRGSTIVEMAATIHKDFARQLKFARVWGGTKFSGQRVQRDYVVQEGDIVELHI
jgi:ribosome-interacting GTPase 1